MAKKKKHATRDEAKQAVLDGIVDAVDEKASGAAHQLAEVYLMLSGVAPTGYTSNAVGFIMPPDIYADEE